MRIQYAAHLPAAAFPVRKRVTFAQAPVQSPNGVTWPEDAPGARLPEFGPHPHELLDRMAERRDARHTPKPLTRQEGRLLDSVLRNPRYTSSKVEMTRLERYALGQLLRYRKHPELSWSYEERQALFVPYEERVLALETLDQRCREVHPLGKPEQQALNNALTFYRHMAHVAEWFLFPERFDVKTHDASGGWRVGRPLQALKRWWQSLYK